MVKVVVLVAGLNLFVPVTDPQGSGELAEVRILVPADAPDNLAGSGNGRVAHQLRTRQKRAWPAQSLGGWDSAAAAPAAPVLLELTVPGDFAATAAAFDLIPDLRKLAASSGAPGTSKLREECFYWDRVNGLSKCTNRLGNPALSAMLVLRGGWEVQPVSYVHDHASGVLPGPGPIAAKQWVFAATDGTKPGPTDYTGTPRPLAEGLAFVADVADEDDVLRRDGKRVRLRRGTTQICVAAGVDPADECYALELVNFPSGAHTTAGEYFHFLALDELLQRPGAVRSWSPALVKNCPVGPVCPEMISSQCFGGGHPWP